MNIMVIFQNNLYLLKLNNNELIFDALVDYLKNPTPIALNFNSNGVLKTQLSLGPDYDGYKMYIFVKIYDDFNGVTTFKIPKPINVTADAQVTANIMNQLINQDPSSSVFKTLTNGNLNDAAKSVISLASTLNRLIIKSNFFLLKSLFHIYSFKLKLHRTRCISN